MDKFQPIKQISINNDQIGFVEYYPQFAYANMNMQSRIEAITNIASVCYANPKAFGSESLYNRLAAESAGLPSSSFEFVPILLDETNTSHRTLLVAKESNIRKFGETIYENGKPYFLTNYRALLFDYEDVVLKYFNLTRLPEDKQKALKDTYLNIYNTEDECKIIEKHFKVFNFKVDLPTRSQMVRHRTSWQELSRRYVSGSKVPFEFYISDKMKSVTSVFGGEDYAEDYSIHLNTQNIIDICLDHYQAALAQGVKPEEARRIIPQAAYSQIWGAFQPSYLANFFSLRLDSHAQREIREVATAMKELIS